MEHPNRTNQQFKLVDTDKPMEDTPDVYRFQTALKAGETKTFTVKEERDMAIFDAVDQQRATTRFAISSTSRKPARL